MYNLQLETFIVVADLGSFNKAAEALYITPPAVTKQINLLEKDLDLTATLDVEKAYSAADFVVIAA